MFIPSVDIILCSTHELQSMPQLQLVLFIKNEPVCENLSLSFVSRLMKASRNSRIVNLIVSDKLAITMVCRGIINYARDCQINKNLMEEKVFAEEPYRWLLLIDQHHIFRNDCETAEAGYTQVRREMLYLHNLIKMGSSMKHDLEAMRERRKIAQRVKRIFRQRVYRRLGQKNPQYDQLQQREQGMLSLHFFLSFPPTKSK